MQIEGKYIVDASPERVYAALLDPAVLAACIPGCSRFERIKDNTYEVTLTVGISMARGTYKGSVTILDQDPPRSCVLSLEGSGAPGFITGRAHFNIIPKDGDSEIQITSAVEVGGPIARVGQRVMEGISKHLIGQFFRSLGQRLQ